MRSFLLTISIFVLACTDLQPSEHKLQLDAAAPTDAPVDAPEPLVPVDAPEPLVPVDASLTLPDGACRPWVEPEPSPERIQGCVTACETNQECPGNTDIEICIGECLRGRGQGHWCPGTPPGAP